MPTQFRALLPLALALTPCSPSAAAAPPRLRRIDVRHVALDLRFDWARRQAAGTAAITLAPLRPTNRVSLDAGNLEIGSVTLADGTPLRFQYDGGDRDDGLVITLGRRVPAGEAVTIRIGYRTTWHNTSDPNNLWGSDGKGLRFFGPTTTEPLKRRQIWSAGRPDGNRYWFPAYDAPDDSRTTELTATVESPLTVISNGRLEATRTNADGTRTFHWRMDRPYPNHLTSIVVGEYTDVRQEANGITLQSFGYPDEVEAVRASVIRLPDMMRFYTEATGTPYPNDGYAQVFVQDLPFGWGNAGAATATENMVDDEPTHADYRYIWDGLEAEVLAHQWFGGSLTARDWRDAWLDRGFARYFDGLFNERANGRAEFLLWHRMSFDLATYLADWNNGARHPVIVADPERAKAFANDNYPYFRGSLVLHLLRTELGDSAWWRAIRRYARAHAGRQVTTADFRAAVETEAGRPMGWFFDQWLYRMGHPVFDVSKTYDSARTALVLRVRQTQQPNPKAEYPETRFFQGFVEVEVDNSVHRVWLAPKAENVFRFPAPSAPRLVNFDFESAWIKELRFPKPIDELLYQLEHDRDVTGQRWALAELANAARLPTTSAADRETILDGLRKTVLGDHYWRLRVAALTQWQGLAPVDSAARAVLRTVIARDRSWVRATAVGFLGTSRDSALAPVYLGLLRDPSHPVSYAAAIALGQSRSPLAFDALAALALVPSWKGENRLSALAGLKELGDPRGAAVALEAVADQSAHRWTLATPRWDYRLAGAETLAALGRGDTAYPLVLARFQKALEEDDVNDAFSNALLVAALADPRGQEVFDRLKARFKDDANAMAAVGGYEKQFREALKR